MERCLFIPKFWNKSGRISQLIITSIFRKLKNLFFNYLLIQNKELPKVIIELRIIYVFRVLKFYN